MSDVVSSEKEELERLRLDDQKRKLIGEVRSSVEASLFRTYRNAFAVITATLAAVGVVFGWPAVRDQITKEIKAQIEREASEPIEQAKKSARDAQQITGSIVGQLEKEKDDFNRMFVKLDDRLDTVNEGYADAQGNLEKVKTDLNALGSRLAEADELIKFLKTTVQANPVSQEDLKKIDERLKDLAEQASKLGQALNDVSAPTDSKQTISNVSASLSKIAKESSDATHAASPRESSVVYVQFAGGARSTIQKLTTKLRQDGWSVPGEQRLQGAVGKYEIRYFYEDDQKAAETLATDIKNASSDLGLVLPAVVPKRVPLATKQSQGIIELWVQIP